MVARPADAVRPQHVAGVDPHLNVADLGAEDVVARVGDARVAGQPGEQDDSILFGQRRYTKHRAAARSAEDDLHPVHVGELFIGGDRILGTAFRVFDDQLQHAPVDSAGSIDLVRGHLLRLNSHRAIGLTGTRQRFHHAYPERAVSALSAASSTGNDQ